MKHKLNESWLNSIFQICKTAVQFIEATIVAETNRTQIAGNQIRAR